MLNYLNNSFCTIANWKFFKCLLKSLWLLFGRLTGKESLSSLLCSSFGLWDMIQGWTLLKTTTMSALGWAASWHEVRKMQSGSWKWNLDNSPSFLPPAFPPINNERSNIQMENLQTTYTNGTWTYDLREPAQETSLLSTNHICRKSDHFWLPSLGDQLRKPNKSPITTGSETAMTWLVIDSFPNFCTHFQLRTNRESSIWTQPVTEKVLLLLGRPAAFPGQKPPVRAQLKPSLFFQL